MSKTSTVVASAPGITIRKKKLASGIYSLYLDIVPGRNGKKREYVFLKLYLIGDKEKDKETVKIAKAAMGKFLRERQFATHDLQQGSDIDFFAFFEDRYKGQATPMCALEHLRAFHQGRTLRIRDITPAFVRSFHEYLKVADARRGKKKLKSSAIHAYYFALSTALRAAHKEKLLVFDFNSLERPKKIVPVRRFLEPEEIQRLYTTPMPQEETSVLRRDTKRAYLFSCFCGLRLSDNRELRGHHIDFGSTSVQKPQVKTDEAVTVPLNESALLALSYLPIDPSEPIFNLPVQNCTVNEYLSEWAKATGLRQKITFHSSRHTFAALLLNSDVGIFTTQQLLGHRNIASTLVYVHILDTSKKKAVKIIPGLT